MTNTTPNDGAIPDPGPVARREANRRRTRDALRAAAKQLFLERGFDAVSVAEIARTAGVTEKTAFNHFPTKEDLLYSEMENWQERLVAAIHDRPEGQTMLDAFRDFVATPSGLLTNNETDQEELAQLSRLVIGTPSLLAREARTVEKYTEVLAGLIAEERGVDPGDPVAWVAAHAMMGVHRALLDHVRRTLATGRSARRLPGEIRRMAHESCALLADGLDALG